MSVKYNKPHALKGYYPDVEVDYSKIILSHGNLEQPVDPKVEMVSEGLKFSWDASKATAWPMHTDQVMMLAYFPEDNKATFEISGAKRSKGFDILSLSELQKNKIMEVYMAFKADDRTDVATSVYLGRLEPKK